MVMFPIRFVNGSDNPHAYNFYHWSLIDIFCYFSHHFVTIPPIGWINAAHVNGVSVLGTFITEGDVGQAFCTEMLKDTEMISRCSENLALIAKHHGFDGWLINIENVLESYQVEPMLNFVRNVRDDTKKYCGQKSLVIWYDSVIHNGELKWQNELNSDNFKYFDASDGIYLNYNWTKEMLTNSYQLANKLNRPINSVYVGIDVFGRGCFGGGGWNCRAALEEIRNAHQDLSVAIFAPGWVHEVECKDDQSEFLTLNDKFWKSLSLPVRHFPREIPIRTTFCRGFGFNIFNGSKSQLRGWFNLAKQQPQLGNTSLACAFNTEQSFNGGGCIALSETIELDLCRLSVTTNLCATFVISPKSSLISISAKYADNQRGRVFVNTPDTEETNNSWSIIQLDLQHASDRLLTGFIFDISEQLLIGSVSIDQPR